MSKSIPTRTEKITINIKLDGNEFKKVANNVEQIVKKKLVVGVNDTLNFNYTFWCEYFGDVEENLNNVLEILDKADKTVIEVDSDLLDNATCLVVRVVEKLREIKNKVS